MSDFQYDKTDFNCCTAIIHAVIILLLNAMMYTMDMWASLF